MGDRHLQAEPDSTQRGQDGLAPLGSHFCFREQGLFHLICSSRDGKTQAGCTGLGQRVERVKSLPVTWGLEAQRGSHGALLSVLARMVPTDSPDFAG